MVPFHVLELILIWYGHFTLPEPSWTVFDYGQISVETATHSFWKMLWLWNNRAKCVWNHPLSMWCLLMGKLLSEWTDQPRFNQLHLHINITVPSQSWSLDIYTISIIRGQFHMEGLQVITALVGIFLRVPHSNVWYLGRYHHIVLSICCEIVTP